MATKKNLKARAAKGSLLSIIGFVVIKADDQRSINVKGKILVISGLIDHLHLLYLP
tara:strand:- start:1706 stop:1873 length:168 start_codon:yes stop_codon:yes gene_type:complete